MDFLGAMFLVKAPVRGGYIKDIGVKVFEDLVQGYRLVSRIPSTQNTKHMPQQIDSQTYTA